MHDAETKQCKECKGMAWHACMVKKQWRGNSVGNVRHGMHACMMKKQCRKKQYRECKAWHGEETV
jgi:hypothetical protein